MTLEYYLGKLGMDKGSSEQAQILRHLILTQKPEPDIISEFKQFILSQKILYPDTIRIINKALMVQYGAEYLGLGKDDFLLKSDVYKQLIHKFPNECSFKLYFAEAGLLSANSVDDIFPVLKEGMLQDTNNRYYPSADLFEFIHDSEYSFEFDILLLEKYYQPCNRDVFDDWISGFKEQYKTKEQQEYLENLKWKPNNCK